MGIVQMSESLANMIAAGEVVERPASVVKELVENSIDANSTWIKIELKEAGIEQIRVTDNGDGISDIDCERAFLRHATSKIKDETDLFRIKTLGFRGEALASIASVSRLSIKTSTGEKASTYLFLEGGHVKERSISDARKGTEITVNDLFFNTPARLKYMKTIHTELGHITDYLNRLALSHPEVRFEAVHNGKILFQTAGSGDLLQVIAQVYGMKVAKKMIPLEQKSLDFVIRGYIGKPEVTRASRNFISIIVNGRYIRNYLLTQAIIRAYHSLLMIGRFPIVVLSIEMDPYLVDFNVHPTKLEARFSKEKELIQIIEETIKQTFRNTTLIPEMQVTKQEEKKSIQDTLDFESAVTSKKEKSFSPSIREPALDQYTSNLDTKKSQETPHFLHEKEEQKEPKPFQTEKSQEISDADTRVPMMFPIGQLHGTYILAQNETGLYMIDQHAAQERVKYEYYRKKLSEPIQMSQELLLPLTFEFSRQEAIFINQFKHELEKVGLFFKPFGNNTYIIRSYPSWFPSGHEEEVIREMVQQIIVDGKIDLPMVRDELAALMSCKRSIKANHYLNNDDMFQLLEDLRKTKDPFTCPHGRPIIVHFTSYELEKMFKRIQ